MAVYPPTGVILGAYVDFHNNETGDRLDREDWGITLEIASVSNTGLTIACAQSGGQQIGQLGVYSFTLVKDGNFVPRLNGPAEIPEYETLLQTEGTTELTIDWVDLYGDLPSGEYILLLYVSDIFDESQVHPLMDDFHDRQIYDLEFTIP